MNRADTRKLVVELFLSLRGRGQSLGIGELLAAVEATNPAMSFSFFGEAEVAEEQRLKSIVSRLWCHDLAAESELEMAWSESAQHRVFERPTQLQDEVTATGEYGLDLPPPDPVLSRPASAATLPPPGQPAAAPADLAPAPIRVRPPQVRENGESMEDLQSYWPISTRMMTYAWKNLRRLVPDGPADVLDVDATVEKAVASGFFLEPVFSRRETNHAHLVLMLDQNGSMMPFHRFSRDVADTASNDGCLEQLDVCYFHNAVDGFCFRNPYLTEKMTLKDVMASWTTETSVIIFSDAGAARSTENFRRVQVTMRWLAEMQQVTRRIAWLNPMPTKRWPGTSAQMIANLCSMFPIDTDNFHTAIDLVRGQTN